jgi:hypothetical protein
LLLLVCVLALACAGDRAPIDGAREELRPDAAGATGAPQPDSTPAAGVEPPGRPRGSERLVRAWGNAVAAGSGTLVIGVVDGDDDRVFGRIRDLVRDETGNIFILDDQSLVLAWFDGNGAFRGATGRRGGGPGEFRAPVALGLDAEGRVEVLDLMHRRISTFVPQETGLLLHETRETPFPAVHFCRLGRRYFVLASRPEGIVHELTPEGVVARSFGALTTEVPEELAAHRDVIRDHAARGRLLCVEQPPSIVVVHEHTPLVRAFAPDGAVLWETRLPGFRAIRWLPVRDGRGLAMNADPETGTAHTTLYATMIGPGEIAVTLHEGSLANPLGTLQVRLLALNDGREVGALTVPAVPASMLHGQIAGFANHPFPRAIIAGVEGDIR